MLDPWGFIENLLSQGDQEDIDEDRRDAMRTMAGTAAAVGGPPNISSETGGTVAKTGTPEIAETWHIYGGGHPETGATVLPPLNSGREARIPLTKESMERHGIDPDSIDGRNELDDGVTERLERAVNESKQTFYSYHAEEKLNEALDEIPYTPIERGSYDMKIQISDVNTERLEDESSETYPPRLDEKPEAIPGSMVYTGDGLEIERSGNELYLEFHGGESSPVTSTVSKRDTEILESLTER